MDAARTLSTETLLAHEPFVRTVVRGLVRDEADLQDVLQETWLRGLAGVPADERSLRGWLARVARNLALDQRRRGERRGRRERSSARPEAVEGADAAYAKLATQREVVDAVLALEEPYRGVVLLRYYEGAEPSAIAARLGRSPATVRSQLSRAHELLRERLDKRCGREAWAGLGLPFAWPGAGLALKLVPAAACAALALGGYRWIAGALQTPERGVSLASAPAPEPSAGPAARVSKLVAPPEARVAVAPAAGEPEPEPAVRVPSVTELAARPLDDRLALAVQLMRTIEDDLLRVDPELVARHQAFLSQEGTGITRILKEREGNLVLQRLGGAYFSFATRRHSYNCEPDLSFHQGMLQSGFYGGQIGLLYDAGPVPVAAMPTAAEPIPGWVPEERFGDWSLLWGELDDSKRNELPDDLQRPVYSVPSGHTFLVRVHSSGEHDHLVAFTLLQEDDGGGTFLWRILASWPLREAKRGKIDLHEHEEIPPGPAWLATLSTDERIQLLSELRARAGLLEVPGESRQRFARRVPDASFGRVLPENRWDPLLEGTWQTSYYSFEKAANDYQTAILGLRSELWSGFAGRDEGLFLDLGKLSDTQVRSVWEGTFPRGLDARAADAWNFLFRAQPERKDRVAKFSDEDSRRAAELGLLSRVPVVVGHVYLLRSVLFGDRDELVCFEVLDREHEGVSFAWQRLQSWPIER